MWIKPDRLFDGETLRTEVAVRVEDGCLVEIGQGVAAHAIPGTITPGFVDLQINGGGGVLLNNDPSPEGIATIAAAHRRFGTVAFMPTVITDAPGVMEAAADAVIASTAPEVIGLHIEGPHISIEMRGTHSEKYVRPFEQTTLTTVEKLRAAGRDVIVTIAPEVVSQADVSALAGTGAIVSIGHTIADAETVENAFAAGATCGTHLFNAMSQMTARQPGAVGAFLSSSVSAGIIADRHHVDLRLVALAFRSNPGVFLVSDAMATVGGPDSFSLYGQTIRLVDGCLLNSEGNLAGAHTTLESGIQNLTVAGVEVDEALRSVTSKPANVIGRNDLGRLVGRDARDVLVLKTDLSVRHTLADLIERL